MIDFASCELLIQNTVPLKNVSFDSDAKEYMTESLIQVVNFDAVKNAYIEKLAIRDETGSAPKSCDALYLGKNGEIVFIEFKNGKLDKDQRNDIRIKILDSLLIFFDITGKVLNFIRNNVHFILVYNEEKNPTYSKDESLVQNEEKNPTYSNSGPIVQNEEERTFIKNNFIKDGGNNYIRFKLRRYKKMYFKEVYTYTKKEFEKYFVDKYS